MIKNLLVWVLLGLILLTLQAVAGVPRFINYQGRLTDNTGKPVADGNYLIRFIIYDAATGGNILWDNSYRSVAVANGLFSYTLGDSTALSDTLFSKGTNRYLGVKVGADPEITPRVQLVSSGYAFQSLHSDTAALALRAAPASIDSIAIINGSISFSNLGRNGAALGQVAKWNGSSWAPANDSVGICNWTVSDTVLYTNKLWGLARGSALNSLYGAARYTMVNWGSGSTTGTFGQDYTYATVSGGSSNAAAASFSTVAGGITNVASGKYSTVSGGGNNSATGGNAVVGGGEYNSAGDMATIAGGTNDTASGSGSTIGGGTGNVATLDAATIAGGAQNRVSGTNSVIGGGSNNSIGSGYATIPGGAANFIAPPATYGFAYGEQVQNLNNAFRAMFYNGRIPGVFQLNHDDMDPGLPPFPYVILVGSNPGNGNNAFLTPGGIWTNGSSRTIKENFNGFDRDQLLKKISDLQVDGWNYKNSTERHVGPCAEDFVSAFDVGSLNPDGSRDNRHLSANDVAGVALAGVKASIQENEELKARIQMLNQQLSLQSTEVNALRAQLATLLELVKARLADQGK